MRPFRSSWALRLGWVVLLTALGCAPGWAAEKRLALVVGIGAYAHLPVLNNSVADARLVADKLRGDGFEVDFASDPTRDALNRAVRDFGRRIAEAGGDTVALFYYAGHGVQDESQVNYLIGADADVKSQVDLPLEALRLDSVLGTIEAARPRISFAVIDACRDNSLPASTSRGSTRGLAVEAERRGLLIAFSTEPGKTADDGPAGRNSPFAAAFAQDLDVPGLEAANLFRDVSRRVLESTNQVQFPWITQRLTDDFYFRPGASPQVTADMADKAPEARAAPVAAAAPGASTLNAADSGEVDYGRAVVSNTAQGYSEWLEHHPDHPRRKSVLALLQRLSEQTLWDSAQGASSPAAKRDALERLRVAFPEGVYADKAKTELDRIDAPDPVAVPSAAPEPVPAGPGDVVAGRSIGDVPAQPHGFYYVTGLDATTGYGWLALRFHPSFDSKWSDTHLGQGTLLTVIGRSGEWLNVRLQSGETGWASARYLACCTTDADATTAPAHLSPQIAALQPDVPAKAAGGLYYVRPMDGSSQGWLALRRAPSFKSTWSNTHLVPGTLLGVFGRSDPWLHVRLQSGETGWVNANYVACCR